MWNQIERAARDELQRTGKPQPHLSQLGRGATLETKLLKGQCSVQKLRKGRMGDVQPQYHGQSVQHAHWFRQLRRLQCYVRHRQRHETENAEAHGIQLWRSILCAKGFPAGFQSWWAHECKTHLVGTPFVCPIIAPSSQVASAMYESFACEVRSLERSLAGQAKARLKKLREENAMLVFQDIKKQGPDRVDLLLNSQEAKIESVQVDSLSLTLDRTINFDDTVPCCIGLSQSLMENLRPFFLKMWMESCLVKELFNLTS